jgi:hypothetical protein
MEFEAQSHVEPLLDGFGHLDRYYAVRDGSPFEGITLRLFDPATGEWSIHWADMGRARTLLPPMVGRFIGGSASFSATKQWMKKCSVPVPLDATHDRLGSVGTGVFGGWREDVGNELDHDLHAAMMGRSTPKRTQLACYEQSKAALSQRF